MLSKPVNILCAFHKAIIIAGSFRASLFIEWGDAEDLGYNFWLFYDN